MLLPLSPIPPFSSLIPPSNFQSYVSNCLSPLSDISWPYYFPSHFVLVTSAVSFRWWWAFLAICAISIVTIRGLGWFGRWAWFSSCGGRFTIINWWITFISLKTLISHSSILASILPSPASLSTSPKAYSSHSGFSSGCIGSPFAPMHDHTSPDTLSVSHVVMMNLRRGFVWWLSPHHWSLLGPLRRAWTARWSSGTRNVSSLYYSGWGMNWSGLNGIMTTFSTNHQFPWSSGRRIVGRRTCRFLVLVLGPQFYQGNSFCLHYKRVGFHSATRLIDGIWPWNSSANCNPPWKQHIGSPRLNSSFLRNIINFWKT